MSSENPLNRPEQPIQETRPETQTRKEPDSLTHDGKKRFTELSEKGKDLAIDLFERRHQIPGVGKLIGKLEIAFWDAGINNQQENMSSSRTRVTELESQISAIDQSHQEISGLVEQLKTEGIPGGESLKLKLKELENKKIELGQNRKDAERKIESSSSRASTYASERDRIADTLIAEYDKKLSPLNAELENLQSMRAEIDLQAAVKEAEHQDQLRRLGGIEKRKKEIEQSLRKAGMSDREISNFEAVTALTDILEKTKAKIQTEQNSFSSKQREIDSKIGRIEDKARGYQSKREQFTRVKERKPLQKEDFAPVNRGETIRSGSEILNTRAESSAEATIENPDIYIPVEDFMQVWNLTAKNNRELIINPQEFQKASKISKSFRLDVPDFKKIVTNYFKYKKRRISSEFMENFEQQIQTYAK
jgi:chromosome segregation ATPase